MDEAHFDALSRLVGTTLTRRRGIAAGAVLAGMLATPNDHAAAGKRKKRRKRKRKEHKQPTVSCAQSCSAPCSNCHHRPVGPPLCGSGANGSCNQPCLSDSDCVGTGRPYCLTGHTKRLTNIFEPIDCPQGHPRICYDVIACG